MHNEDILFNTIFSWLDNLYLQAIKGGSGADSAKQLAHHHRCVFSDTNQAAENLVIWESSKAAISGFISGLGGVVALPVTLPAGLAGLLLIQFRMIAAIAILGGHSPDDIRTRHLIYLCLGGGVAKELLHNAGLNLFRQLSSASLETVTEKAVTTLMTRITTDVAAGSVARLLPLVGGIMSGGMDWVLVRSSGALACEVFLSE